MYYITRSEYNELIKTLREKGKKAFMEKLVSLLEKKGYASLFYDIDFYVDYGYIKIRYDKIIVGALFIKREFLVVD